MADDPPPTLADRVRQAATGGARSQEEAAALAREVEHLETMHALAVELGVHTDEGERWSFIRRHLNEVRDDVQLSAGKPYELLSAKLDSHAAYLAQRLPPVDADEARVRAEEREACALWLDEFAAAQRDNAGECMGEYSNRMLADADAAECFAARIRSRTTEDTEDDS